MAMPEVDPGRFVPDRMGGGFVLFSLVDVPGRFGTELHPHGPVGIYTINYVHSFYDRSLCHQWKGKTGLCGRYRSISLCATSHISSSPNGLYWDSDIIALPYFHCIIDPHLCLLQLHRELRREAIGIEIRRAIPGL